MVKDSISNLIIKIKNANTAHKDTVSVAYSKLNDAILTLLAKEGYIASFSKTGKKVIKSADVVLAYDETNAPKITSISRVSKLSRRMYVGAKDIKPVRNGYGTLVLSTPKGILSDVEAKKLNVGGEILFKIW